MMGPGRGRSWRAIGLVALAGWAVTLWCSVAQAEQKKVVGWYLDQIRTGDHYVPPGAGWKTGVEAGEVKIGEIKADATAGIVMVSVMCGHSTVHWPQYKLEWEFTRPINFLRKGDTFSVHMKLSRLDDLGAQCPPGNHTPYGWLDWREEGASLRPLNLGSSLVCFDIPKGQEKTRVRIYPYPDNEKLTFIPPIYFETIVPLMAKDVDASWGFLVVDAHCGIHRCYSIPGALYLFKAVYEGEPLPPVATGGQPGGGQPGGGQPGGGQPSGGQPGGGQPGGGQPGGGQPGGGQPGGGQPGGGQPGGGQPGGGQPGGGQPGGGQPGGGGNQPPWGSNEPTTNVSGMTLQAGKRSVKQGETVSVPIWLINGQGLIDMNFNLTYDANVAQSAGPIVKGNVLGGADFEANPNQPGLVQVGFVPQQGGVTAPVGTVAQIPFKAVGAPGSRTALHLVPRKSSVTGGAPANLTTIDGEILVVTDEGLLPGDTTGDGQVNMDDVLAALKMSVGLLPVNMRADMDKDGQVTAADARLIREVVLGIRR